MDDDGDGDGDGEDSKTNCYSSNNYISGSNINGLSMFSEEKIIQALRVFLTDDRLHTLSMPSHCPFNAL